MPEYLALGVYSEEIEISAKPIEGVSTSTAGFLGVTEQGPTSPAFIANVGNFQKKFGGFVEGSYLAYGIEGFFRNSGQRCFVGRIIGKSAGTAQTALTGKEGSELIGITAAGPGTWGNAITLKVEDATLY